VVLLAELLWLLDDTYDSILHSKLQSTLHSKVESISDNKTTHHVKMSLLFKDHLFSVPII